MQLCFVFVCSFLFASMSALSLRCFEPACSGIQQFQFSLSLVCFVSLSVILSHLPLNVCVESCFYNFVTLSTLTFWRWVMLSLIIFYLFLPVSAILYIGIFCYALPSCNFVLPLSAPSCCKHVCLFSQMLWTSIYRYSVVSSSAWSVLFSWALYLVICH